MGGGLVRFYANDMTLVLNTSEMAKVKLASYYRARSRQLSHHCVSLAYTLGSPTLLMTISSVSSYWVSWKMSGNEGKL